MGKNKCKHLLGTGLERATTSTVDGHFKTKQSESSQANHPLTGNSREPRWPQGIWVKALKSCVCVCVVVCVVRGIVVYLYYKVERCLSVSLSVRLFVCTE